MFEGIYFQFPKLGFLLFVYLGCEALCPLRSTPIYFPKIVRFGEIGVKPPLWLWISKWAMITLFIIALMSPVKEHPIAVETGGMDILIVLDPSAADAKTIAQAGRFIECRGNDRIGLWVPDELQTVIPMTREHTVLLSMLGQHRQGKRDSVVTRRIERFFGDSQERERWIVVISNVPKSFVFALPAGMHTSVIVPSDEPEWAERLDREYPDKIVRIEEKYFDFYYVYPLFFGFLAMLAYLYGRNQKGLK